MFLLIFRAAIFRCISGCDFPYFRHQHGSQKAPQIDTKSEEKSKRCSPVQLIRSGCRFDVILNAFWSQFGRVSEPFGCHLLQMLAFLGRNLGIFLSPSIRALLALIRHIEFPFLVIRATRGKSLMGWVGVLMGVLLGGLVSE